LVKLQSISAFSSDSIFGATITSATAWCSHLENITLMRHYPDYYIKGADKKAYAFYPCFSAIGVAI
jgi:hypothetical protein